MPASIDRVVADTLRFKNRLQIGEDAYALLRARKTLFSLWDTGGAGWTGVGVAKSSWVATSFFAPAASTGVMSWLGLAAPAAAVTPVGWLVVAGLIAGGGYYGVTRWMASGPDKFVDTIPKFINTPVDLLGAGLFDLTAPLALQVARADGFIHETERETIARHFVEDWGFDPVYVSEGLRLLQSRPDARLVTALAKALSDFQRASPDCNPAAMQHELMQFLNDVVEADGVIASRETRALASIEAVFKAENALLSRDTVRRARGMAKGVRTTVEKAVTAAGGAVVEATRSGTAIFDEVSSAVRAKAAGASQRSAQPKGVTERPRPPADE